MKISTRKSEIPLTKINLCTVSFNTKDLLARQIECLKEGYKEDKDKDLFDLTVLDNASSDGTGAYLIDFIESDDRPEFLTNFYIEKENRGYSFGCNSLGSAGTGEIIGLLNADVWLTTDDVRKIAESFDNHPEMDIMGPKQRNEKGQIVHAGIEGTNTAPKHRGWNVFDPDDALFRDYKEMVTVSGSAYFIRRSVWDELTACPLYRKGVDSSSEIVGAFLPTPHYY